MLTKYECFLTTYLCSTSLCFGLQGTPINEKPVSVAPSSSVAIEGMAPTYSEIHATASTTLKRKGNQLKSTQKVTWNSTPSGLLFFTWVPPKGSKCSQSSFPIKKYDPDYNYTHVDRSILDADHQPCRGLWKAEVVTKDNRILSSSEIKIS